MDYYSAIKTNSFESVLMRWMKLEPIIQSEVSQKDKDHVQLFVTPWTVDHQAPLSMGFSKQEYWNGLPFPSPENLSDPGTKPQSPALQAGSPALKADS